MQLQWSPPLIRGWVLGPCSDQSQEAGCPGRRAHLGWGSLRGQALPTGLRAEGCRPAALPAAGAYPSSLKGGGGRGASQCLTHCTMVCLTCKNTNSYSVHHLSNSSLNSQFSRLTDSGEHTREAEIVHSIEGKQMVKKLFSFLFTT